MSNFDTTDHVLWPYDDEEIPEWDEYDEADFMYSERINSEKNLSED